MNYRTMVKGALAFSLSLMVGSAWARTETPRDVQAYGATFEPAGSATVGQLNDFNYGLGTNITAFTKTEGGETSGWMMAGVEEDESKIIAGGPAGSTQTLQLNTDANTLSNKFSSTVAGAVNTAIGNEGTAFFETDVKFVASDTLDAGIPGGEDATKFAIYAYVNENVEPNTTNLVVFHAYYDGEGDLGYTNEVFDTPIDCDVYTKLRIEMKKMTNPANGQAVNVFSVKVGNAAALASDTAFDAYIDENIDEGVWFLTVEEPLDDNNKLVSSLNFKGTGEIDNISVGTIVKDITYAIDWTDSDGVTITNAEGTVLTAADTNFTAGASIYFTADATPEGNVITNILVNGTEIDGVVFPISEYTYTVGEADAIVTVLAGVPAVEPETYAISWTVDKVVVSNTTDSAAIVEATAGSYPADTVFTFYPTEGSITNVTLNGSPVADPASPYVFTVVDAAAELIVKAGTADSGRVKPAWANDADDTKFWKWVDDNGVTDYASTDYTAQYLMNVDETANPVLKIDSIEVTDEGSKIVISAADGNTAIDLAAINGVLNVSVGSTVTALTSKAIPAANKPEAAANKVAVIILSTDGAFAKATVDFTAAGSSLSEVQQQ